MIGRSVVNINIGFGIQIILNLLLFTLITIWISCYLDPDEIGRTFQSPYFQGLFHNSQLCKYVLLNVALQQYYEPQSVSIDDNVGNKNTCCAPVSPLAKLETIY